MLYSIGLKINTQHNKNKKSIYSSQYLKEKTRSYGTVALIALMCAPSLAQAMDEDIQGMEGAVVLMALMYAASFFEAIEDDSQTTQDSSQRYAKVIEKLVKEDAIKTAKDIRKKGDLKEFESLENKNNFF